MTSPDHRPDFVESSLPDWFLALVEGDGGSSGEPIRELITAVTLMYFRRERPGVDRSAARRALANYTSDPIRCEGLAAKIRAFRLSCGFERLKRAGLVEDVSSMRIRRSVKSMSIC